MTTVQAKKLHRGDRVIYHRGSRLTAGLVTTVQYGHIVVIDWEDGSTDKIDLWQGDDLLPYIGKEQYVFA